MEYDIQHICQLQTPIQINFPHIILHEIYINRIQ